MNFRNIAAKFETTSFDGFDEATQTWVKDSLKGKVMPIDRFLSIFHRATTRRALGIAPNSPLPASHTIRVPSTGEIFIVGLIRSDQKDSNVYDSVGILSKAYSVGQVKRKATIGTGENLGVLVESVVGNHYMDIELRTSSEIDGATEEYESKFFLTAPVHSDIQPWDYISLNGTNYQVTVTYIDSGLKMCRVIQREDPRVDVTYHRRGATSAYSPSTGVVTSGLTDFPTSGFFEGFNSSEVDETTILSKDVKLIIAKSDIGFYPETGDELTYSGQTYKVHRVHEDFLSKQIKLHCRV